MEDRPDFELIEVSRKRRTDSGSAGAARSAGGDGKVHRYANYADPNGVYLRRPGSAGSGADRDGQTQPSGKSEGSVRTHSSGSARRGHPYKDYGTVNLGPLPQLDLDAVRKSPEGGAAQTPQPAASAAPGPDPYTAILSRKYTGKGKKKRGLLVALAILIVIAILALLFSFFSWNDPDRSVLPKPAQDSMEEMTQEAPETVRSND